MALSSKNRFFLRQNPFFGLEPCRPHEGVPEQYNGTGNFLVWEE